MQETEEMAFINGNLPEFFLIKLVFQSIFLKAEDGMLPYFKSGKREGLRFLFNKPPKWNERRLVNYNVNILLFFK